MGIIWIKLCNGNEKIKTKLHSNSGIEKKEIMHEHIAHGT